MTAVPALIIQDFTDRHTSSAKKLANIYTDPDDQITQIKKLLRLAAIKDIYSTHTALEYDIADNNVDDMHTDDEVTDDDDECSACGQCKHKKSDWTSAQRHARVEELLASYDGKSVNEWYELLAGGAGEALDDDFTFMRGVVLAKGEELADWSEAQDEPVGVESDDGGTPSK